MSPAKRWREWRSYWDDVFFRMDEEEFDHWERRMRFDEHTRIPGLRENYVINAVVELSKSYAQGKHPKMRDLFRTIRALIPKNVAMKNLKQCGLCRKGFLMALINQAPVDVWCNCEYAVYLRDSQMADPEERLRSTNLADQVKQAIKEKENGRK